MSMKFDFRHSCNQNKHFCLQPIESDHQIIYPSEMITPVQELGTPAQGLGLTFLIRDCHDTVQYLLSCKQTNKKRHNIHFFYHFFRLKKASTSSPVGPSDENVYNPSRDLFSKTCTPATTAPRKCSCWSGGSSCWCTCFAKQISTWIVNVFI